MKSPGKAPPRRSPHASTLPISRELVRKYLTGEEVQRMIDAVTPASSRYPERDRAVLLLMYRHGLRVSELCRLQLEDLDIEGGRLHVARLKRGLATTHPIRPLEVPILRSWLRARESWTRQRSLRRSYLFLTERGGPLTRRGVHFLIQRCATAAHISVPVHPHMLRHSCGFALAEQGADAFVIRDYLGHRSVSTTNIYIASSPARFERLWR